MTVCVHFCEAFSTRRRQVGDVKMRVGIALSARFWLRFLIKFAKCPRIKFKVVILIFSQMKGYKITLNKSLLLEYIGVHHDIRAFFTNTPLQDKVIERLWENVMELGIQDFSIAVDSSTASIVRCKSPIKVNC